MLRVCLPKQSSCLSLLELERTGGRPFEDTIVKESGGEERGARRYEGVGVRDGPALRTSDDPYFDADFISVGAELKSKCISQLLKILIL